MSKICRKSFDYWKIGLNSIDFLEEIVEFTDIVFTLLESFSKGKALTVRTDRISKEQNSDDETAY